MTRHLSSPISRPGTPRWEWQQSHFLFPSSKPFVISYQLNQSNLLVLDWLGSHQTECAKTNWDFVSTGAQPHSPEVMTPKTLKTNSHSSTKTIQHRRVSVLFLHFGLLSPSGDLGIGLVWDNPTGPHRTTTFQSDCWNPLQTELNYLWGVLSCSQDDIRWF